ncbi:hypothetical protein H4R35_006054 [Dimargaris xerosporica]|nr:hypothetical protein H4R35_006054 [Dimargaris xerosporica]
MGSLTLLQGFILAMLLALGPCYAARLPQPDQLAPAGQVSGSAATSTRTKPMEYQVGGHPGFSVLEGAQQVAKPHNSKEEAFYVQA